ncbi:type III pantothenate kinase [uncultured Porticoccus sp.]|uniref:type III pantothenate kinase n=1 Tax=uncultured Porticoccus sp. TaxID=1256050 RepID=UPI0030DB2B19|tara:strand:- start:799 stop:1515 length:717 start_codon:yes stop_codon:yes gene_type:complete
MIIDIDAGNSRIKWRVVKNGTPDYKPPITDIKTLLAAIETEGPPTRIRLSSVGGRAIAEELAKQAAQWGCQLQQARTTREVAGVHCGYLDPSSMGVDRWLALLAVRDQFKDACVVVDAGTAITVDLLNEQGYHLGGYIVPGFPMIYQSLNRGTSNIRLESVSISDCLPGKTTGEAVSHGAYLMIKTLIEASRATLQTNTQPVRVIVTGGDGSALIGALGGDCIYVRDLVLDGLEVMFP